MQLSKRRLVPYKMASPGFEAVYTGEKSDKPIKPHGWPISRFTDKNNNVIEKWSVWTWRSDQVKWDEEIRCINAKQERLGHLDVETRQIRAHIGSLVLCEPGIPMTIDDLLLAIGRGRFLEPPLHDGCWCCGMWWKNSGTQHGQDKAMAIIEHVVLDYLAGKTAVELSKRFPDAEGFIRRVYKWLPPVEGLTELQRLMLQRMLLPFEFFTGRNTDYGTVSHNCFEEGGLGVQLDEEISKLAGLPKIYPEYKPEFQKNLQTISNTRKKDLYRICGAMAHGLHGLSVCHHSTFRWIERWVHDIGTLSTGISDRIAGTERRRLAELLFGYTLALDKWLLGKSMHFLLMDVSYTDFGFDPKNEILRVYTYLGEERTAVKEWLAACLWKNLSGIGNPRGLVIQKDINERAEKSGISTQEWINKQMNVY